MRISDWSSDVCSSDLQREGPARQQVARAHDQAHGEGGQKDRGEHGPTIGSPAPAVTRRSGAGTRILSAGTRLAIAAEDAHPFGVEFQFRQRPVYRGIARHSLYVAVDFGRREAGPALVAFPLRSEEHT